MSRFCHGRSSTPFDDLIFLHLAVASVAQLVELLICNQSAGGSSPSAGSIISFGLRTSDFGVAYPVGGICLSFHNPQSAFRNQSGGVPERPKGTDCKSVGDAFGGSNPPPSTKPHSK